MLTILTETPVSFWYSAVSCDQPASWVLVESQNVSDFALPPEVPEPQAARRRAAVEATAASGIARRSPARANLRERPAPTRVIFDPFDPSGRSTEPTAWR